MAPLTRYVRKRDFERTPEPRGRTARARGNRFVVQKHAARRLHYDFRLEMDGVLKSWAVPKGPSDDPADKRLAVRTEDHPIEYAKFEGMIPKGQYGAGKVEIWDSGTWMPEGSPRAGLAKGHLAFSLDGRRLRGSWNLVRLGHDGDRDADPDGGGAKENWLLIRKVEVIDRAAVYRARRRRAAGAAETARPVEDTSLQLATLVREAPAGDDWLHERKLDGYRVLCRIEKGKVRFLTRSGLDWTDRFPG